MLDSKESCLVKMRNYKTRQEKLWQSIQKSYGFKKANSSLYKKVNELSKLLVHLQNSNFVVNMIIDNDTFTTLIQVHTLVLWDIRTSFKGHNLKGRVWFDSS